jgi:hypothetical protein
MQERNYTLVWVESSRKSYVYCFTFEFVSGLLDLLEIGSHDGELGH